MTNPSAYDSERLNHINHLMDEINDDTNDIYEQLVDREFDSLKVTLGKLISKLRDIQNSVEDEV
jgi:hypothetical protein